MAQLYFYFDQTRCMGCQTCVVACKDWKMLKPGRAKLRNLHDKEEGVWPNIKANIAVFSCNHCDDPACKKACPSGAIFKDPNNGIVYVDRTKCTGEGVCITACPYGAPQVPDDNQEEKSPIANLTSIMEGHAMAKCDMCRDRQNAGLQPACVSSCLARALDFGTYDDLKAKYPNAQDSKTSILKGFNDENTTLKQSTKPNFLFKAK